MRRLVARQVRRQLVQALEKVASPIEAVALEAGREAERLRQQLGRSWAQLLGIASVHIPAPVKSVADTDPE